jgi:hypothetical protein
MPKFILVIFFILLSFGLKAQTWELGVGAGGAGYMGDLNPSNPVKISGPSIGAFITRNFNGYWSARASYNFARISAADSNSASQQFRNRNLSFTDNLAEASVVVEFNFLSYIPEAGKNVFTPYLYVGLAALSYNPTTIYQGEKYDLRNYETEGEKKPYGSNAISIPYGFGIKYNITGKFTLGAEIGYRNPNTDYLDDVSGNYANQSAAPAINQVLADRSGEKTGVYLGTPGTQRGDLNPRDTYFFTQITFSYTFVTSRCYFQ